jgi:hypothetical protein
MSSPILHAYSKLPLSVRRPVGRAIQRSPKLTRTAAALSAIGTDRFATATPDTLPALERAFETVRDEGLLGDYYEFGLYRGFAFLHAQKQARRVGLDDMHFYGFDSFAGLPEIDEVDGPAGIWKRGDYSCSRRTVEKNLLKNGACSADFTLVEGFYDESLTNELRHRLSPRPVALALIDCDLYASTVPVLTWLEDLLQHRSILLFDDWNCADRDDDKGERRAFREFLEAHPEWTAEPWFEFGWHGQAFRLTTTDRR